MITGCQNVSMGYKERGGHCKELGMMQGKGNKISMDIYSFKNRNKYNKTYHTLCTFYFTFAVDILALLLQKHLKY